jgi:hypothetical protein
VSPRTIRKASEKCILRNTYETNLNRRRTVKTMAPYTPPINHYSQMDVSMYDEDKLFAFIGKTGKKFYWLTQKLGLDYLWYDKKRKVIEIWGPFYTHQNQQSAHFIYAELEYFMEPKLEENLPKKQDEYVQETIATC